MLFQISDPIFLFSVISSSLNVLLGLFVLLSSRKGVVNKLFFLLTLTVVGWISSVILRFFSDNHELVLAGARLSFLFATLLLYVLYLFSLKFPLGVKGPRITTMRPFRVLVGFTTLLVALLSVSPLLVEDIIISNSIQRDVYGGGYYLFITFFLLLVPIVIYNFLKKREKSEKTERVQMNYILAGILLSLVFAFTSNIIIPFVSGVTRVAYLGPSATIFFVGFTSVAILKHKLFNIRVVATELLVFLLWISTLIRTLLSETNQQLVINSAFFIFVLVTGVYLIRSVLKEVEAREHIEKLAKDLRAANEKLHKTNMLKTEFVSVATHQLRSPLTAIKGYTSMILEGTYGEVPEKMKEPIERVFRSTESLAQVVQDFLDVSRIEQRSMRYDMVAFNFKDLVEEVINEQKPNIDESKLEFALTVEPPQDEKGYIFRGDRLKLKQVVTNLIDNAIKYTNEGFLHVNLMNTSDKLRLEVVDSGMGIDQKTLKSLFKKFHRADNADEVNVAGTGLGLYIASQIVETHDGKIWAESEGRGKGTTFIVELSR